MTRWPRLHRALICLGAIQSAVTGLALIATPMAVATLFLAPAASAAFGMDAPGPPGEARRLMLATVGALLIFYGSVMAALAIRFDARAIRVKGMGEIASGLLFAWLAWRHAELLGPPLALLAVQHLVVGPTYLATSRT
jgi:hypothetical protein